MGNKEFSLELEKRTRKFAVKIIRLSTELANTPEGRVIKYQITKAGTSVGANYREANRSRSRADFINKIKICESEASEVKYWLQLIEEANLLPSKRLQDEYRESSELLAIFTKIGKSLKTVRSRV